MLAIESRKVAAPAAREGALVTVRHEVEGDLSHLDPRLVLLRCPESAEAARFRVLRHRLQEKPTARTIVVSSAREAEGKTTCATNLALALAEDRGRRVLLVESHLVCPAVAGMWDIEPPVCFYEQLRGHVVDPSQPWTVLDVDAPGLRLHVAALSVSTPKAGVLEGLHVDRVLRSLRGLGYDYVVVDAPPVLGTADVNLLLRGADGYVLTAWAHQTRGKQLQSAVEQLGKDAFLGVVLFGDGA